MKKKIFIALLLMVLVLTSVVLASCGGPIKHARTVRVESYLNSEHDFQIKDMDFYEIVKYGGFNVGFNQVDEEKLVSKIEEQHGDAEIKKVGKIIYIIKDNDGVKEYFGVYDCEELFNGAMQVSKGGSSHFVFAPYYYFSDAESIMANKFVCEANAQIKLKCTQDELLQYYASFPLFNIVPNGDGGYIVKEIRVVNGKESINKYYITFETKADDDYMSYDYAIID